MPDEAGNGDDDSDRPDRQTTPSHLGKTRRAAGSLTTGRAMPSLRQPTLGTFLILVVVRLFILIAAQQRMREYADRAGVINAGCQDWQTSTLSNCAGDTLFLRALTMLASSPGRLSSNSQLRIVIAASLA